MEAVGGSKEWPFLGLAIFYLLLVLNNPDCSIRRYFHHPFTTKPFCYARSTGYVGLRHFGGGSGHFIRNACLRLSFVTRRLSRIVCFDLRKI
jgi:hypothetical protein